MDFIFGILGIVGGLLCAVGDVFLDLKGKGNVKSGPNRIIESNWEKMSEWRFHVSILLAAVGVPLYLLGFLAMNNQLAKSNDTVALLFLIFAVVGASGGLFIHILACLMPIITKTLQRLHENKKTIESIASKIFNSVRIPFIIMFISLVIATSVTLIYAIIAGYLNVPMIFILLNPMGLLLVGNLFRLINKQVFSDLPGIIMPSLGISMIRLMTVLSVTAG